MMKLLGIRNKEEQQIEITQSHLTQIKQYLKAMDLIVECPVRNAEMGLEKEERILFTQPGMRYCQAQAHVYSLMQDETFGQLTEDEKHSSPTVFSKKCAVECLKISCCLKL